MSERVVVAVLEGLVCSVFLPGRLDDIPVQVLNLDDGDPIVGSRYQAFQQALKDPDIVDVDYTFIGTEDEN